MPMMFRSEQDRQRDLEALQASIAEARKRRDHLAEEERACFTESGDIRPFGLSLELSRLDAIRRSEQCPCDDSKAQTLIQGQQNEVVRLQGLRASMLSEIAELNDRISRSEEKAAEMAKRLQKRG
jgi:hypothetical protein